MVHNSIKKVYEDLKNLNPCLKGAEGDALHAVLCGTGFNIRWLMRAIVAQAAKAAKAFFFALFGLVSMLLMCMRPVKTP